MLLVAFLFVDLSGAFPLSRELRDVRLGLPHRVFQVAVVGNVVPLEHRLRLVTRDQHCDLTVDPGPDHVSDRGPAEVMEERLWFLSGLTSRLPGLPELLHRAAGFWYTTALFPEEDQR